MRTVPLMSDRQMAQLRNSGAQLLQQTRWPHGKKTVFTSWSIHTLHVRASFSWRFSSSRLSASVEKYGGNKNIITSNVIMVSHSILFLIWIDLVNSHIFAKTHKPISDFKLICFTVITLPLSLYRYHFTGITLPLSLYRYHVVIVLQNCYSLIHHRQPHHQPHPVQLLLFQLQRMLKLLRCCPLQQLLVRADNFSSFSSVSLKIVKFKMSRNIIQRNLLYNLFYSN